MGKYHPLYELRLEQGLTQQELAEKAGLGSQGCISRIESGKGHRIAYDTAHAITTALGVGVSEIFLEEELTNLGRPYGSISSSLEMKPNRQKLHALRVGRRLTQVELANKAGLSLSAISNIETGMHRPSYETAKAIAKALGLEVSDIFEGNEIYFEAGTPNGKLGPQGNGQGTKKHEKLCSSCYIYSPAMLSECACGAVLE